MTYQKAAQDALDIQNASNIMAVAGTLVKALDAVREEARAIVAKDGQLPGEDWVSQHPIVRLLVDKLSSLAGRVDSDHARILEDYEAVEKIAKRNLWSVVSQ